MKKILITGSKGFIGSKLTAHLKERGYEIVETDIDVRNRLEIAPYFKDIEFVIHTACKVRDLSDREACYTTNVLGTSNVAELCLENGCKMIHFSTTQRYTSYGRTKQEAQIMVEDYAKKGLKAVVVRLCPIITKDSGINIKHRYYLEDLVVDIGNIIEHHDFSEYKLISYQNGKRQI